MDVELMKSRTLLFILLIQLGSVHAQQTVRAPVALVSSRPATINHVISKPSLEQQEIRAQLSPRQYTTLAAEIGAKINRLPLPEGSSFKQGQVLATFDCGLHQAQLSRAQATLTAASSTWTANKQLEKLNSIGRVELEVSEAEVVKNRAEVSAMRAMLAKCTLIAPFSGRVADQKVREQQFVQPGQAMLEIIDDSVLELEFIVPSKWLAWIKPGYGFQVFIDETAKAYPVKVHRIGAKVDPVSQSVKLVAAIDGKFADLMSGMSGRVSLAPPTGL